MLKLAVFLCILAVAGAGLAHAADTPCQATSVKMLDHLDHGDYTGATADFNERMKAAMSADQLARIWPAVAKQFGPRGTHDQATLSRVNGYAVVITPLHYGQHVIDARVVCEADGKVAGFFIKPQD